MTYPLETKLPSGVYNPRHFVVVLYLAGELLVAIVGHSEHGEFAMMKRPIPHASVGVSDV